MDLEQRKPPAIRASDRDRDDVLVRLHDAYADGRLTEAELDQRIDRTLAARTRPELAELLVDLPGPVPAPDKARGPVPAAPAGRFQVAYKSGVRRVGRWRVPERYNALIYKGDCLLDLRTADLDGPVTTIRAVAYKSSVEIIVPPGVRAEVTGFGVSSEVYGEPAADAPVVRVHGVAYKGTIEIRTPHA